MFPKIPYCYNQNYFWFHWGSSFLFAYFCWLQTRMIWNQNTFDESSLRENECKWSIFPLWFLRLRNFFFVNFVLARCFACTCCFLQSFNLVSQTKDQSGFLECCEWLYKVFNFACKLACDFLALNLWDFIYKNCYYLPIFEFFVVVTHCQLNIRLIGAEK